MYHSLKDIEPVKFALLMVTVMVMVMVMLSCSTKALGHNHWLIQESTQMPMMRI